MTEQAQDFHDNRQVLDEGPAGGSTDAAGEVAGGREILDAIDRLVDSGTGTGARSALDAISQRIGRAYAALDDAGSNAADGERIAAERDDRARAAFEARRLALLTASRSLAVVFGATSQISALLTWQPDRVADLDRLAVIALRGLTDIREHLATLAEAGPAALGPDDPHPFGDLGECYAGTLDAWRELHRHVGAHVALLEIDMTNLPALAAMERVVAEVATRASVMSQGLGLRLVETGMAR